VLNELTQRFPETHLGSGVAPARDWHMQVSHALVHSDNPPEPEWKTLYTFTEVEYFQADIDAGNFAVSRMTCYPFVGAVICTRRIDAPLDAAGAAEVAARGNGDGLHWVEKWTLEGGHITHRRGPHVVEERKLATERARVEALRDIFGVGVELGDEQWIKGLPSALSD
jgi:arylamine N-acetyltransferase